MSNGQDDVDLRCRATDFMTNSTWYNPYGTIIINREPAITQNKLNATSINNYTTDNLTAYFTTYDNDGDSVRVITDWRNASSSISVLNMPFDINTSAVPTTTVNDYSTYENNGTLNGNIDWISSGKVGGAYLFDVNDYIEILDSASLNSPTTTQELTISFWINIADYDSTETWMNVIDKGSSATNRDYMVYFENNSKEMYFSFGNTSDQDDVSMGYYTDLTEDTWYYMTFTADGTTQELKYYLNGLEEHSASTDLASGTFLIDTSNNLVIGSFNGALDEVHIYDYLLSPEEIESIYRQGLAGTDIHTTLPNSTYVGESWTVAATPTDGYEIGTTVVSNPIIIQNIPPTAPTEVGIDPALVYTNSTVTCLANGSTDADADPISYYYLFNDTATSELRGWSTNDTFDCTTSGCDKGDTLYCYAKAVTSNANSSAIYDTVAVINSLPDFNAINDTLEVLEPGATQTITPFDMDDPDQDDLTLACCIDTDNTCTATTGSNICTGGSYSSQAYPYSSMSCTYTVSSTQGLEYVRCRLYDGEGYSVNRSDSYLIELSNTSYLKARTNYSYPLDSGLGGVDLIWTDNSDVEDGFEIERSTLSGEGFEIIATLGENNISYHDENLEDNTVYYYRIRSYDGAEYSNYSSVASAITADRTGPSTPEIVTGVLDGIVAYYKFDEGTEYNVTDQTWNDNDGLITDATWTSGYTGTSIYFDGDSDEIKYDNDTTNLDIGYYGTISFWMKPEDGFKIGDGYQGIMYKNKAGNNLGDTSLQLRNDTGELQFYGDGNFAGQGLRSTLTSWSDTWYHIAITWTGSNKTLYIDGIIDNSILWEGGYLNNTENFYLGYTYSNDMSQLTYFNGTLDELQIYNRALNSSEIEWLYNGTSRKLKYFANLDLQSCRHRRTADHQYHS